MLLNLNKASLSLEPANAIINAAIERVAATAAEAPRPYLGASIVGYECARRIQFSWWSKPDLAARTREIFERGHFFEGRVRQHLVAAGGQRLLDQGDVCLGARRNIFRKHIGRPAFVGVNDEFCVRRCATHRCDARGIAGSAKLHF